MASAPRFPAIRPEVPSLTRWGRHMERAEASNWFTNFGELSQELEGELLSRWGFPGSAVVCTNNGTSAIAGPLIAENIVGPVLLPAFTFPATLSAVKMAGGQPKLLDVSAEDWLVDAKELDKRLKRDRCAGSRPRQPVRVCVRLQTAHRRGRLTQGCSRDRQRRRTWHAQERRGARGPCLRSLLDARDQALRRR